MVEVTVGILRADIRNGTQADPDNCAIARRMKLMGFRGVRVSKRHIRIGGGRHVRLDGRNRLRLRRFVNWFDLGKDLVKPITLKIGVPERLCPRRFLTKAVGA